ncbi:hypothetical protein DSO57_1017770 [Entomophthora muscae]|uniref:Uncharacterized protein n=1 Tax=Entomophthora muscae TaxID=34485 RepID=A0ACC2S6B8_9FUNG|nr:hypothetical protein DSO57_1017770 [Entomophthora muscae]
MGHTFNDVGEEYDGGEVYEGVNSAASIHDIPWRHWISGKVHEEQNNLVFQKYPWYDLSEKGPYVVKFNTSGKFPRWYLQISTSGMAEKGSFRATLDGVELPWNPPGTLDRTFSTWFNDTHGLSRGSHQLQFEVKKDLPQGRIIHQLCNIELMEYSRERKFDWKDPAHVSAYPTYNYQGQVSYRPTNEYCLMRNMTSAHFRPVCKEGLWLKFLERVSLLDEVDIRLVRFVGLSHASGLIPAPDHRHLRFGDDLESLDVDSSGVFAGYLVQTKLLEVAPLPNSKVLEWSSAHGSKNKYKIHWYRNSRRIYALDGQTNFLVYKASPLSVGVWEVVVTFTTPQVRKDPTHLLTAHEIFILKRPF